VDRQNNKLTFMLPQSNLQSKLTLLLWIILLKILLAYEENPFKSWPTQYSHQAMKWMTRDWGFNF